MLPRALNLDDAAREIELRRSDWAEKDLQIGELTWRAASSAWPRPLGSRSEISDPDSVGFRIRHGNAEGAVVLFRGGWADVEWWLGTADSDPEISAPEIPDVSSFGELLDALLARWADLLRG